ncbi:hypothetical protein ACFFLS_04660 [Flavobacterium procerum]|uniref:Leucine-rich repeat domain-containing protein n=1 Tax=Flavobacterium procerum TaxID=1455569 RepID=A0ABV6BQJ3_9FLAO
MEDKSKLEIEINGAKDIAFLKNSNLDDIEDLSLLIYTPVSLRFLKNFKNLKRLLIAGSIKDYSPVSGCTTLETLHISTSGAIDNLDFIKPLSIKTLELECFRTKAKPFIIPNLETIESLSISSVSAIADLSFLSEFTNLEKLFLFEQQSKVLFGFTKLKKLEVLHLTNMFHLKNFQELKTIPQLETLNIHQFYINRKIKTDAKAELMKIIADLTNIKTIRITINGDSNLYNNTVA